MVETKRFPRQLGRSVVAILIGFFAVVILSLSTDQLLHVLNIYPPWGQPMSETSDNLLALTYRCVYGIFGSYLTAWFAPHNPMGHVWLGAAVGFVLSLLGAIATIPMKLGPAWYPIALVVTALPCAWLGGFWFCRSGNART